MQEKSKAYYTCPQCDKTYPGDQARRIEYLCCSKACIDRSVTLIRLPTVTADPEPSIDPQPAEEPDEKIETNSSEISERPPSAELLIDQVLDVGNEVTSETVDTKAEYICPECGAEYSASQADIIGSFCQRPSCQDQMILLEKAPDADGNTRNIQNDEIGLGILVCDISGSMEDFAFSGRRVSKLSLVAGNVARGIWDLTEEMVESAQENAYVALIYFAKEAKLATDDDGLPFIKSISQIAALFDSARDLADFILDGMRLAHSKIDHNLVSDLVFGKDNTKHYTNINSALDLAYRLKSACLSGDMSAFGLAGTRKVIEDVCISTSGKSVSVPNIRCLIYSDGAHNYPKKSKVINSFNTDETSVLISTFIGKEASKGAVQMEQLAGVCPRHGDKSYFLIDDPEAYQKLRGLFRMSSGVSGFCPSCMPRDY